MKGKTQRSLPTPTPPNPEFAGFVNSSIDFSGPICRSIMSLTAMKGREGTWCILSEVQYLILRVVSSLCFSLLCNHLFFLVNLVF